jgi:hypothetical protein
MTEQANSPAADVAGNLIEHSSFGTSGVKGLRSRTPAGVAAAIVKGAATPRGVFVSYARDETGREMANSLVAHLRAKGIIVVTDRDPLQDSPTSILEWMETQIAERTVLCILSDQYVKAFDERSNGSRSSGARYEARAILKKMYHECDQYQCPIIPVAAPEFDVSEAPGFLRSLVVTRFDPEAGVGAEELVARIKALDTASGSRAPDRRALVEAIQRIGTVEPTTREALELTKVCIGLAREHSESLELLDVVTEMIEIITAHGDTYLMKQLIALCFPLLSNSANRPTIRARIESVLLINAKGWLLTRRHRLRDALDVTEAGVRLAEQYGDLSAVARGRVRLAEIFLLLANGAPAAERSTYLAKASESAQVAFGWFSDCASSDERVEAMGACLILQARCELARLGEGGEAACSVASEYERRARDLLKPSTLGYYRLLLLQAEIASLDQNWSDCWKTLDYIIKQLEGRPGARQEEILGLAYQARAQLPLSWQSKDMTLADLRRASHMFYSTGMAHFAAECEWQMLLADSATLTSLKITALDTRRLEKLTQAPEMRLRAIAELEFRSVRAATSDPVAEVDWDDMLKRLKAYQEGRWSPKLCAASRPWNL